MSQAKIAIIMGSDSDLPIMRQAADVLKELELDFDDYKRKALEKEQKLGRQLQDERNKLLKQSKS